MMVGKNMIEDACSQINELEGNLKTVREGVESKVNSIKYSLMYHINGVYVTVPPQTATPAFCIKDNDGNVCKIHPYDISNLYAHCQKVTGSNPPPNTQQFPEWHDEKPSPDIAEIVCLLEKFKTIDDGEFNMHNMFYLVLSILKGGTLDRLREIVERGTP